MPSQKTRKAKTMAKKKDTRRTQGAGPKSTSSSTAQQVLREGWKSALEALSEAEGRVETQIRALLRNNKINVDDAAELLREFRAGVERERKRGMKELETRLAGLQQRVKKQGRHVAKLADDAVQSGLAALNIPSRREVALLTRKLDELSKRIGTMRARKK